MGRRAKLAERDRERGALEQAASTAHTIHGAIKTGKAIASAAKGAAASGPYGAVAGAVWGARKHIGTIAIVVIVILLLPVLFILIDRKSTRLNSSHVSISYAVFCLKKKFTNDDNIVSMIV